MILLVDNYDSFTYNLAQYIGKFDEVQVLRNDDPDLYQVAQEADALVFSPGPGWPKDAGKMEEMIRDFAGVKPILGICLGHQAIAEVFGGRLGLAPQVMHGKQSQIQLEAPSPLYAGVAKEVPVMRYHSLTIEDMPEDFVITSRTTDDQAIMGIQHRSLPIYGFQYHPESIGTPDGLKTIENFIKLVKERKMKQVLAKVAEGMDLSSAELEAAMEEVVAGRASETQVTALLLGLKMKGETVEERTAIAKVMQAYAVAIPTEVQGAMDNCGTGGDRSYSFNISTTAAFVLAGGGIKMAKHGNRSISSKSGSADVLEALGINLDLGPEDLGRVFEKAGIVFLFAKNLHPGMRYIMPARLALGVPTVMNLTGPLINPIPLETQLLGTSRPDMLESTAEILKNLGRKRAVVVSGPQGLDEAGLDGETQLLGTSRPDMLESTAEILKNLGRKRAVVVSGPQGLDEAGLDGATQLAILENGQVTLSSFQPEDIGMERIEIDQVRGGDAKRNAEILISVLKNEASPFLEVTVLNAGLGFYANGKVDSIKEGIALAREVIASGAALEKLRLLQEYQK